MTLHDNWHEGTIGLNDDGLAHFWVKSYKRGSVYGINGGRISKLTIKINGATVANYDRGWDVEPDLTRQEVALAYSIILDNYN